MANTDYKFAEYKISHNSQLDLKHEFTFWWADGAQTNEYFDVSIAPVHNKDNLEMKPLIEVKRTIGWSIPHQTDILHITLQNNNPFDVSFMANHVRITQ
jgi:hypothetical protein